MYLTKAAALPRLILSLPSLPSMVVLPVPAIIVSDKSEPMIVVLPAPPRIEWTLLIQIDVPGT